jgi:hypothetical protein
MFNVIRTVQNFPSAKGVRIIEVGLYYVPHAKETNLLFDELLLEDA